jgi:hypothetical protein
MKNSAGSNPVVCTNRSRGAWSVPTLVKVSSVKVRRSNLRR